MKLISKRLHAKLVESAQYTVRKSPDALLSGTVPVSAEVAKEIGIKLEPKVAEALANAGPRTSVVQQVKLSEYIEKLEAYEPDEEPAAQTPAPTTKRTKK